MADGVPELHHDRSTRGVNVMGNRFPAIELLGAIQAGHIEVTLPLLADSRRLGDQQAGAGTLGVVLRHQRSGYRIWCAVARQRRHHDAVAQSQVSNVHGIEQGGFIGGHTGFQS
jgi:hypothetical protein